ncbi:ABC transporter substrate-binding protein [Zavarzinia sp.]|uniref:ABC transporter substrate-binding protein n=1 Tax=Zavarzinia sp. TaxID=2027920 RepID=UPI00356923CC
MKTLKTIMAAAASLALLTGAARAEESSMRLEWVMQGQFAGPILALEKGYYKAEGLDMKLEPAGPDLKPTITVAQGSNTFGIGHPNQVIAARANGVPLVTVLQLGQKSASTYIARKETGIKRVEDMPGHSVGLWFGGDEHEFMAMLAAAKVDPTTVKIIPQGFDIVAWLNKQYEVMQVTRYNELQLVYAAGYKPSDLVFLEPGDYGVAMVNTGIFAREDTIKNHPEKVQGMVNATLRGWQEALADPVAAAKIVVKYNAELTEESQVAQIKAMGDMMCAGPTLQGHFGMTDPATWPVIEKVLIDTKQIDKPIKLEDGYTNAFWEKAPDAYKKIACPAK